MSDGPDSNGHGRGKFLFEVPSTTDNPLRQSTSEAKERGWVIHSALHKDRLCAAHSRSTYGLAFSTLIRVVPDDILEEIFEALDATEPDHFAFQSEKNKVPAVF